MIGITNIKKSLNNQNKQTHGLDMHDK